MVVSWSSPPLVNCQLPEKLFGTDGIRGRVGELLTPNLALAVGLAAGKVWREFYPGGVVIIGQDSRNSSDMLSMAITAGLTAMGFEVWHLGLCPTPCVAYLAHITGAVGGIMISASHNPPSDNGIKFFGGDGKKLDSLLTTSMDNAIRQIYYGHLFPYPSECGSVLQQHCLTERYAKFLLDSLPAGVDFSGLRIVLDLAWGASVELAPFLFETLGAEVICLHSSPDGERINVQCGSTHLEKLQQAVREYKADLGFAFDGDADRAMGVDARGRVVCGDYILYLWGKHLQSKELLPDNLIVATVMANLGFEMAWRQLGGKLIRTPVGDQHVQTAMWDTGAMLGGEQSGHIICHHFHYSGDGLQTALQLTSIVKQAGVSLAELVDNSFSRYPQVLKNVRVENQKKRASWHNCDAIQKAIADAEAALGAQGRVLIRASGTEPLIRVMVEAESPELTGYWSNYLAAVVAQSLA
ncbi:MAG: phosphoglucosamine mutase [Geminocystis sp.]|nr:phosphoglucosamine mutase [Geminocystis sp.]MCS7147870.1 phosphoglucosamine mutase [Geminocystis sp.]MDW8117042.1 phosphoglucosamine mutase [Geminocystis sp.]MDW8462420.1 phosphoglucosamine mutase [Geminocystis sp.]